MYEDLSLEELKAKHAELLAAHGPNVIDTQEAAAEIAKREQVEDTETTAAFVEAVDETKEDE